MSEKRFVPSKYASHTFDRKTEKHYYVTDEMIGCKELFEEIEKLEKENEQFRKDIIKATHIIESLHDSDDFDTRLQEKIDELPVDDDGVKGILLTTLEWLE